jgi:hypothetical protein
METRSAVTGAFLALSVVALSAQASAPGPKPGPEEAKLAVFVGTWNIEGEAEASAWGTAGKIKGVETYEWLPGNFFLISRQDWRQGTTDWRATSIMGFDRNSKMYTTRVFDNAGNSGLSQCTVSGDTWTCHFDGEVGQRALKARSTMVVTPNVITAKGENSVDGVKWIRDYEIKGTRVK